MRTCKTHPEKELKWHPDPGGRARSKFGCAVCLGLESAGSHPANVFPLVKYDQQFWRDRPLTQKEKAAPPRRPT